MILFDWFSKTKVTLNSFKVQYNKRVLVMCVHARQDGELWVFSSAAVVLYNMYYCVVAVWMAACLTGYSDYLTGFREPLSTSYICHTGLKTVYPNHW